MVDPQCVESKTKKQWLFTNDAVNITDK